MPGLLEERNTDESHSKQAANIFSSAAGQSGSSAELPKGVVLDKNGKPYVSTSFSSMPLLVHSSACADLFCLQMSNMYILRCMDGDDERLY